MEEFLGFIKAVVRAHHLNVRASASNAGPLSVRTNSLPADDVTGVTLLPEFDSDAKNDEKTDEKTLRVPFSVLTSAPLLPAAVGLSKIAIVVLRIV